MNHETHGHAAHPHEHTAPAPGQNVAQDPVCGMDVNRATADYRHIHAGREYVFCSAGCLAKFRDDPTRYLAPSPPAAVPTAPADTGIVYTCPMHPQVRQPAPGNCPICGMALEPLAPSAEAGPSPELRDMTRRMLIGAVLTLPLFVLAMGAHLPGVGAFAHSPWAPWVELLLATPVVLWGGWPFFVRGRLGAEAVALGNPAMMARIAVEPEALIAEADRQRDAGATVVFVARAKTLLGLIAVADPVKATAAAALEALRAEKLRVIMVTGDNRRTAEAIARQLGIDQVEADVPPARKHEIVTRLKSGGAIVAMAGDGVNDAPALAAADVGIAMGTGTDVAMQSAGVTLVKGDLNGIVRARRLSRATMGNIRQNLFLAFVYNALGVPVAAGVLYPVLGLLLSPIFAAAAMSLSSVSVIGNALRLRTLRL